MSPDRRRMQRKPLLVRAQANVYAQECMTVFHCFFCGFIGATTGIHIKFIHGVLENSQLCSEIRLICTEGVLCALDLVHCDNIVESGVYDKVREV